MVWNPADPVMIASCGDDGKVKMYVPVILRLSRRDTLLPLPAFPWRPP